VTTHDDALLIIRRQTYVAGIELL